jgi:hypothetical protein
MRQLKLRTVLSESATARTLDTTAVSEFLSEDEFSRSLRLEQYRSRRSGRPIILAKIEAPSLLRHGVASGAGQRFLRALESTVRETDLMGWCLESQTIGVVFTELGQDVVSASECLQSKIAEALSLASDEREAMPKISVEIIAGH